MKRREAVEKLSWILKSALFAPAIATALNGCQKEVFNGRKLLVFDTEQNDLVKAIADIIIPHTTSPSASELKVDSFMDLLLMDVFEDEVKRQFLAGLAQFDTECQSTTGNNFLKLNESERYSYLEKVDRETMEKSYRDRIPFYYTFKSLVITIYFSTEQGIKQNLNYTPIPGPYKGSIELKEGDRIRIGNRM